MELAKKTSIKLKEYLLVIALKIQTLLAFIRALAFT